ncbi:HvfA family oxazolone/thioamide-modified RiPP metallophore, partial [Pseudoalteromonas spongiae]
MKTLNKNSVALTVGAAVIGASSLVSTAANANPFQVTAMQSGYMLDAGEGKCGEGKCGGD